MGIREKRQDREERERFNRAGDMPHRKHAGNGRLDVRLESPLGRLYFSREITQSQFLAGVRYGEIGFRYLETIDAPEPFDGYLASIEEDTCFRRKCAFIQARSILKSIGPMCSRAVDRLVLYEEEPRSDWEIAIIAMGLSALSGETVNPAEFKNLAAA